MRPLMLFMHFTNPLVGVVGNGDGGGGGIEWNKGELPLENTARHVLGTYMWGTYMCVLMSNTGRKKETLNALADCRHFAENFGIASSGRQ